MASISLPDMAPNVQTYVATRGSIMAQAMFFSKVYNTDGDVEVPVIRLIDTGKVDSSKPDENGNPSKVFIWSEEKSAGDNTPYYWDQIVSEVELDLPEECQIFTKTLQSGYDVWSRFTNMITKHLYENSKSIVNHKKYRDIVEGSYVIDSRGKSVLERRDSLDEWKHNDGKSKLPVFEWEQNEDKFELKINNEGVLYKEDFDVHYLMGRIPPLDQVDDLMQQLKRWFCEQNFIEIDLEMAKKFRIVEEVEKTDDTGQKKKELCLSSTVRVEHFRDPNLGRWSGEAEKYLWKEVVHTHHSDNLHDPGQKYVRFYSYVNWYFSGLDQKIYQAFVDPNRTLFLYTDLAQTQIVGGTEIDLLREVSFNNYKKGKYLYEPLNLQQIPILNKVFDTIEVGISETDGTQVEFNSGPTILTVHFRRRGSGHEM